MNRDVKRSGPDRVTSLPAGRTPDISNTTHIFFLPDFAKIDTICSFSFLRLSRQPVIRFELSFFDLIELVKGYKIKKSLSKLDFWMARKSQKTDFLTL